MNDLLTELGKWLSDQGIENVTRMAITADWENRKVWLTTETAVKDESQKEFFRVLKNYKLVEKA